jgi:hypothetical protein
MSAPLGKAYIAVGTKRALASATGLPRRSTSALWMEVLLMPAEVRRSFMISFFGYNKSKKSFVAPIRISFTSYWEYRSVIFFQ